MSDTNSNQDQTKHLLDSITKLTKHLIDLLTALDAHFDAFPDELIKYVPTENGFFMFDHENQHHTDAEIESMPEGHSKTIARLYYDILKFVDLALITANGGCAFGEHERLAQHGYRVRCGERDSFGWLSGIIVGRHFKIVYG